MRVLGQAQAASMGVQKGRITNMSTCVARLASVFEEAEGQAKERVQHVVLGLGAPYLKRVFVKVEVTPLGTTVSAEDIKRLEARAAQTIDARENYILHVLPGVYGLDGEEGIDNPVGMTGRVLRAVCHVIYAPHTSVKNLLLAIEKVHLKPLMLLASPYVLGEAFLSEDEKRLGSLVLDMGASKTDIACYKDGRLLFFDTLALGGGHITRDIAYGLEVGLEEAERTKIVQGSCLQGGGQQGVVSPRGNVATASVLSPVMSPVAHERLRDIIYPRVAETLTAVHEVLKNRWHLALPTQRFVLVGGASQLTGLRHVASDLWQRPVRLGRATATLTTDLREEQEGVFPVLQGMTHCWQQHQQMVHAAWEASGRTGSFFGRILTWFRKNL